MPLSARPRPPAPAPRPCAGATVCPIAIKYNQIFVDAFWNSKRQSFSAHLLKLMRSWALVADVYFLQPQSRGGDESSADFAARVQRLIAEKARLKVAPWDGYLKYYNLGEKVLQGYCTVLPPGLLLCRRGCCTAAGERRRRRGPSRGGGAGWRRGCRAAAAAAGAAWDDEAWLRLRQPTHTSSTPLPPTPPNLQYPDLIEKQRRVFGDLVKQVAGMAPVQEEAEAGQEEEEAAEDDGLAGEADARKED